MNKAFKNGARHAAIGESGLEVRSSRQEAGNMPGTTVESSGAVVERQVRGFAESVKVRIQK